MIDWRNRSEATALATEPASFKAPLFYSLIERLDAQRRCVVLDLGAARTQTIALFSHYRCRLDIADLGESLQRLDDIDEAEQPEALPAMAESLLPQRHGEATDVVLCWDLLNYLDRPRLRAVMSRVAERARPGALVHALIAYSRPNMPTAPGQFVPIDGDQLSDTVPHPEDRAAPRYSPDDLLRCMPGYAIERAMLLRNGMQEFLFELQRHG